jgi:hypothetical protein
VLVVAFGVALWSTIVHPSAYEVRGVLVARAKPDMILVRHEAVFGMGAMDLMAVIGDPAMIDRADVKPGDLVRLAVKPRGNELQLIKIEKLR